MKVSFLPEALRWIPFTKGDYWALKLDPDYRLSLVGTPDRDHLWLLTREPHVDEAEKEVRRALQVRDPVVDAHVVNGLLLERRGRFDDADAAFRKAARLEPDKYGLPVRMSRAEFDKEVRKAARKAGAPR